MNRHLLATGKDHIISSDLDYEPRAKLFPKRLPDKPFQRTSTAIQPEPAQIPRAGIKEIPAFDPDAEISSLALTIPSWISTMKRTEASAKLELISHDAQQRIIQQLSDLCSSSEHLLTMIKEKSNHG